jgi:SAM-dependent methyltransferase
MSSTAGSLDGFTRLIEHVRAASTTDPTTDTSTVKACCAAVYGIDLVTMFLGESYHPGGVALTRCLTQQLRLQPGERVLDIASGIGTTALLVAAERDVSVVGIDLGDAQVAKARRRAANASLDGRVRFQVGDAEQLPVDDATFDAAVCECAFCTFPDKPTAARELARVLRPGGRVGISDVWLEPTRMDPDLAGRVACLADARPIPELRELLESAGLLIERVERHDDALLETIERVEARLRALCMLDAAVLRAFNLRRGIELARRAADVVRHGHAGYLLLIATKP